MTYLLIFFTLFILELIYFKLADKFNIIDKPNERSSHTEVTLRGGGIIFYLASVIYFIYSGFQYPWFFLGLTLMTVVSFLDDVFTLSNRIRLIIHFSSVVLMGFQLELFELPWYFLILGFVITVGVINAYNFMDGINGITVCYSLAVASLLLIVNQKVGFIDISFIICTILSLLIFGFFNFRIKAKCFAGDVGSVTIAYILLFMLGMLIIKTGNMLYILFLAVYGVDAVWTIVRRLYLKENIFKAHRSHLYQILGNEVGLNKLIISFLYGVIQFAIGYAVIIYSYESTDNQMLFAVGLLLILSVIYLLTKYFLIKKYVNV